MPPLKPISKSKKTFGGARKTTAPKKKKATASDEDDDDDVAVLDLSESDSGSDFLLLEAATGRGHVRHKNGNFEISNASK